MLIGSDEQNLRAVEAAVGRQLDFVRTYDRFGARNLDRLTAFAKAGYLVMGSQKFATQAGASIAATSISGHQHDSDLDTWNAVMDALPAVPQGPHIKIREHEEDAKTAAGSGVPTDLNAAFVYAAKRNPDTAHCENGVCWTGWDLLTRGVIWRVSGDAVRHHIIDPYEMAPSGNWAPFIASYGVDLNYLRTTYPGEPIWFGETNAPNTAGAGKQAAWLNQLRIDCEKSYPEVKGGALWQGGNLTETPAELALMKSGFFAASARPAPPAPPAPTTRPVALADLKALSDLVVKIAG